MRDDHQQRSPGRDHGHHHNRRDDEHRDSGYRLRQASEAEPPANRPPDQIISFLSLKKANLPTGRDRSASPARQHRRDDMDDDRDHGHDYNDRRRDRRQDDRRQDYRHRDDDHDYSNMYDDEPRSRRRSRSRSPRQDAGRPSDTIILEGLPFGMSQHELRECLLTQSIASEYPSIDVRIASSRGQRRAFVQFGDLDSAAHFVDEHYPRLSFKLQTPTDEAPEGTFKAYLHYARSRDEHEPRPANTNNNAHTNDWVCPQCQESNFATRSECRRCGSYPSGVQRQQSLNGAADAGEVPSHMLVVYSLPTFINEDMFAKDMRRLELEQPEKPKDTEGAPKLKSTAPRNDGSGFGARPGSLRRVFLMRDTGSNESLKYGFAEFWTVEDASAALVKYQKLRNFAVAACAVTVSNIHMGVFVPCQAEPTPETEFYTFHPLFNPSLRVQYRDLHAYPSQQIVNGEAPAWLLDTQSEETEEAKKNKKRKAETAAASGTTKKPVAMAGKMAMWQRKHDELHVEKPDRPKPTGAIKFALSGPNAIAIGSTAPERDVAPPPPPPPEEVQPEEPQPETPAEPALSFVDRERLMCLSCMCKYKSVEEVDIHEKSRNHRTATEDTAKVEAAMPRLAARDKRQGKVEAAPEYRDRAKERRQAFKQPQKPKTDKPAAARPVEDAPKAPAASKGAGMLAKMGWAAGSGLGANGDGRTERIETNAYQGGVGLGAEGGNLGDAAELAEKRTKGSTYADYVNTVQDKARQRYNGMN